MEVTLKNTKAEILEAYQKAMELAKRNQTVTVADEQEVKRVQEVKANAKELVGMGILHEDITSKYNDLLEAIRRGEQELNEIFGIKKELLSFEAVLIAKRQKSEEMDLAQKLRVEELNKEIANKKEELKETIESMDKAWREHKANLEVQRKREQEEYTYNLKRERQKENDAWEDEKAEREKELNDRELAVEAREDAILVQEKEITELKMKVANIPHLVDEAYNNGLEKGKAKANQTNAIEKSHTTKEYEWTKKTLQAEIDNLKNQLIAERDSKATLEEKLEDAYKEIKTIATETVRNSGVRVIESQKAN